CVVALRYCHHGAHCRREALFRDPTEVSDNGGILLANLLQSSKSTFSWGSFLSFFAFQEGILDTHISALGGWPTVSGGFLRHSILQILLYIFALIVKQSHTGAT